MKIARNGNTSSYVSRNIACMDEWPNTSKEIETTVDTERKVVVERESQVTVHCTVRSDSPFAAIRVWKSTFLVDATSDHSSQLVHAEGIVFQPQWQPMPDSGVARFTLIFEGLPKSCKRFHFEEVIPEPGAWKVSNILRNSTDVYSIELD